MTATPLPPARLVPTVTQPARVTWPSWIEQLLVHETPLIEAAAEIAAEIGLGAIPLIGPAAAKLVAPTIVKQVVDQGLQLFEATLAKLDPLTIDKPNWLQDFAIKTINDLAPQFAKTIGEQLDPMIADAIAKAAPAPSPVAPIAPIAPGVPSTSRGR